MNYKTKLSKKFLIAIGVVVAVFIAMLFAVLQFQSNKDLSVTLDESAQKALSEVLFTRAWIVNHDGGFLQRGIDESKIVKRNNGEAIRLQYAMRPYTQADYAKSEHPLVTKDLLDFSNKKTQYRLQAMSLDMKVPGYELSEFDRKNLKAFKADAAIDMNRSAVRFETIGGVEMYRKLVPLRVERGCLNCHANLYTGQVIGGLSVTVPVTEARSKVMLNNIMYTVFGFFVIAVILGLVYLLLRITVLNPLYHLNEIADALRVGKYTKRAKLKTGDELEELAHTLNQMTDNILAAYQEIVKALASAVEIRDPYTRGHVDRVAQYSVAIAEEMGLDAETRSELEFAAILHDIGKIGIHDAVLCKPGPLSEEERTEMSTHPELGAHLLAEAKHLEFCIPAILHHHERYDGTGYPDRLQGDKIPILARILAVADTYDAMTSDRPYRKGLSSDIALAELKKYSGTQFDPNVVQIFIALVENGKISIKNYWQ